MGAPRPWRGRSLSALGRAGDAADLQRPLFGGDGIERVIADERDGHDTDARAEVAACCASGLFCVGEVADDSGAARVAELGDAERVVRGDVPVDDDGEAEGAARRVERQRRPRLDLAENDHRRIAAVRVRGRARPRVCIGARGIRAVVVRTRLRGITARPHGARTSRAQGDERENAQGSSGDHDLVSKKSSCHSGPTLRARTSRAPLRRSPTNPGRSSPARKPGFSRSK